MGIRPARAGAIVINGTPVSIQEGAWLMADVPMRGSLFKKYLFKRLLGMPCCTSQDRDFCRQNRRLKMPAAVATLGAINERLDLAANPAKYIVNVRSWHRFQVGPESQILIDALNGQLTDDGRVGKKSCSQRIIS